MSYLIVLVLFVVGSHATEPCQDPNSHYVDNTDPCTSQCQYYGKACPIYTFAPTGPGYDCNAGYCRSSPGGNCVAVQEPCRDPNTHYVEHTDPCTSLCQYYGTACPIYTFAPTAPGYDCKSGYCRLNAGEQCVAVPKHSYYAENTDACGSLCIYAGGCPIRPAGPTPPGFNCDNGYCRRSKNGICIKAVCYKREY